MPVAVSIFALAIFVGIDILRCPLGKPRKPAHESSALDENRV